VIDRWRATGVTLATVSSRTRTLSAALRWSVEQGILRSHPLAGLRRPPQPLPRLPLPLDDVERLLRAAAKNVTGAGADRSPLRRFEAEQTELLVRLAADSGARRGELAALQVGDLDGRVLHICRSISGRSTVTTPKSHQYRSLTLGAATTELWRAHLHRFPAPARDRAWLFSPSPTRATFVRPRGLAARFERLRDFAGVPDASLHRLRHTVAVVLVTDGKLLAAQHRLGHRDLSTTLRHYGWAQAPEDRAVADHLEAVLDRRVRGTW
jgi:integrase